MVAGPALLLLFIAGAYAAPQKALNQGQELFSLSALEDHLSHVPEGTQCLTERRVLSRYCISISDIRSF